MNKLMPKKHISIEQSLLGFGGLIISLLKESNYTIEELWIQCNVDKDVKHDFDDLLLTLDYLFSIGVVTLNYEGLLCLSW